MTKPTPWRIAETHTMAVFYVPSGLDGDRFTGMRSVTVEWLGRNDPDDHEGLPRFVVRGYDGRIKMRTSSPTAAMRYALGLTGWWSRNPTQI